MPFHGGFVPNPERFGGGEGTTDAPLLQRVFESIAAARGKALDQTPQSAVGAENMALARAITFDLFGANTRFANEMNPAYATAGGLLPRWEKILGQPPMPGDTESVRRARCAAAMGRFGRTNTAQPIIDVLTATLGPLFVGLTLFGPYNSTSWWPGYGGRAASVTGFSDNMVTIDGLTNVPTSAPGANLVLLNSLYGDVGEFVKRNDGTFLIQRRLSSSSVVVINNQSPGPVAPDYGIGGTAGAPTIIWTMPNPAAPFMSSIAHIDVLVDPAVVPGFLNPDGTLSGTLFAAVNQINPILDLMLPADCTFDWYVHSHRGQMEFLLDEQNLDCEAFGE